MIQIVVPALNEAQRLPLTLRELRRHVLASRSLLGPVEVIVVDNGSTDETASVARAADSPAMPVRVVPGPVPGKGAAVRAGVAATDADIVGFMDADGATRMDALDEAWRLLAVGADVAIGSRAVAGSETDVRHQRVRERGAQLYRSCSARVVPGIRDTQCGFKVMRGDLARSLFADLRTTGFAFDVELLARARARGAAISEFPVVWADVPGSTFSPARHGLGSFLSLVAISWWLRRERSAAPAGVIGADPVLELAPPPTALEL